MKIELDNQEYYYLANMIQATANNLKNYVSTYEKIKDLQAKFNSDAPPSYVNLSPGERESVALIAVQALQVLKQADQATEETPEKKDHLSKIEGILNSICTKIKTIG